VAKPGQTVQPVDVGGNIARVREEFGRAAAEMTGVADAVRAGRGEMTPEEAQTFALGAIPALVPGGKVAGEAAEVAPGVMRGIRAFHGSPYDFERFSMAKVGTGQGAQSWGHGLYFAGNPAVAQEYRSELAPLATVGGEEFDKNNPYHWAVQEVHNTQKVTGDRTTAVASVLHDAQRYAKTDDSNFYGKAAKYLQRRGNNLPPYDEGGHMYEVNINADPEHFLDLEKSIDKQSPEVLRRLKAAGLLDEETTPHYLIDSMGFDWRQGKNIPDNISDAAVASMALREAGIPGIKYLDQGSRAPKNIPAAVQESIDAGGKELAHLNAMLKIRPERADELQPRIDAVTADLNQLQKQFDPPTHNYVVFDDKLIDIIKKYGIAGLIAANVAHFKTGAGNGNGSE
jgi:hypothetical protein